MSAEAGPSQSVQQPGKKRKRTGKEREERKQAAILAAQAKAEESEAAVSGSRTEDAAAFPAVDVPAVDFAALETRLPRALTHLRHVFKRAKTIEMTRLIKKIKLLRSKGGSEADLADLETQRQVMAHINLHSTLSSHLLANIRKHRLLKRTPNFIPSSIVDQLSASSSAPSSSSASTASVKKVENRLCSSKGAALEMKSAVAWLMSEEGAKLGSGVKAEGKTGKTTSPSRVKAGVRAGSADEDDEDEDEDQAVDDEVPLHRQVTVDSDDEEEEVDEAGWESGSISGDELPSTAKRSLAIAPDETDDEDDDEAVSLSPEPITKKPKPTAKETSARPAPSKQLTSSTFLPSLSAGFTRGGSEDSDPDDDFGEGLEDIIGKGNAGVRKNRRGQRARQAIWERKYGKNAKHVQKAREKETEGNIANAYGKRAGPAKSAQPLGPPRNSNASASAPTTPSPATFDRKKPESAPAPAASKPSAGLHPSWEAARLRKQKEATGPKATKIVFD